MVQVDALKFPKTNNNNANEQQRWGNVFSGAFVHWTMEWLCICACAHRHKRHMHEQYPNYSVFIPNVAVVYFNYSIRLIMWAVATKAMHIPNTKPFLPAWMNDWEYFEPLWPSSFFVNWLNAFSSHNTHTYTHTHAHRCGFISMWLLFTHHSLQNFVYKT